MKNRHLQILLSTVLLLMSLASSSQQQYLSEWKKIDSLIEKQGLIRSALTEVNKIYTSAKKQNNDVQVIKALLYKMNINDALSDQGRYENIATLEKEILAAKGATRSILHSIAGTSYWNYLRMNRWQFYQRTPTKGYKKNDVSTWDLEQLYSRITLHFDSSLAETNLLKKTSLERFDPIILKGNVRYLRPTLFDLLAFRAIDYYRNDERYITEPTRHFEVTDSAAFADAQAFATHTFKSNDTASLHLKALKTFQQLITFHLSDTRPDALLDADLHRLDFARNFSISEEKDELYKHALENVITKFGNSPAVTTAYSRLAFWYFELGGRYDAGGDTANRYAINIAEQLCKKALTFKVKNEGTADCTNLLRTINQQHIGMKAEMVNTTHEPFRALISYKNVTNAFIRVVKFDMQTRKTIGVETGSDDFWKKLTGLPGIKSYTFALPATGDHQLHRVEIKIDALPVGEYGILISSNRDFALEKNTLALQQVEVSDISFVTNGTKHHVLNRKSGAPFVRASIQVWEEYYNEVKRMPDIRKQERYTTDGTGLFELKKGGAANTYRNIYLEITAGDDRLFVRREPDYYMYEPHETTRLSEQTVLFTDRALYRPGQAIHFKGIVIQRDADKRQTSVIQGRKTTVILYSANGEPVDSVQVTSNEFGSYSGGFTLAQGQLNGEFILRDAATQGESRIRVEEYKRPKFFASITAPQGTYRLNDTLTVFGQATSYAGNNINNATVTFNVVRRAIIPLWIRGYDSRIWPPFPHHQAQIAHGLASTDGSGKFKITFTAVPDKTVPRSSHPVFFYEISADVTDINGETRSATTSVNIGYEALKVQLNVPEIIHSDSLTNIPVATLNMNDSFEKARVNVSMYRLSPPSGLFRERYWERPDQFIMTRDEYNKSFPLDQYSDELDKAKWPSGSSVFNASDTTAPGKVFPLKTKMSESGWYLVEAWSVDKYGDTARDKKYVLLYKDEINTPESVALLKANKSEIESGTTLKYKLRTNVDSSYVIVEEERNSAVKLEVINTARDRVEKQIALTDTDQSIVVKLVFVKNNRVYTDMIEMAAPQLSRQLNIEYLSFRDKSLPGSGEKWKVKITGVKRDNVAAELLTTMYDASLDQFYPHIWNPLMQWQPGKINTPWTGRNNFQAIEAIPHYNQEPGEVYFEKKYDVIRLPQDGIEGSTATFREKQSRLQSAAPSVALQESVATAKDMEVSNGNSVGDSTQAVYKQKTPPAMLPRRIFNETAFFFPQLHTDSSGIVEFSFTTPEALTTWKWMLLAHTSNLASAYGEKSFVTQKSLMVQPNMPRFVRAGDKIALSSKISNMTASTLSGNVKLELYDAITGAQLNELISERESSKKFVTGAGQSTAVNFNIQIPATYTQPIRWRIIAYSTGNASSLSDGEEDVLPVVTNRLLVTESLTMPMKGEKNKTFSFEKLLKSAAGTSTSLTHERLTFEFTATPAWYAVQALPYLSEENDENAERVFSRLYANALASKIAQNVPALKSVIDSWKLSDSSAFLSNLQKNEELKSVLVNETPWVLDAKNEAQQKKNIALLFDMIRMSRELNATVEKLASMQSPSGAFVWFSGGPGDRFITQYIVSGIGHLKVLSALDIRAQRQLKSMVTKAVAYLDRETKKDHDRIKKNSKIAGTISYDPVYYLYMRSFFTEISIPREVQPAYNHFRTQVTKGWVKQNAFMRAMIALALYRTKDTKTATSIINALRESAIHNEELGMYWKEMSGGYYWFQAPVEAQATLIEAFSEIGNNTESVRDMKTWLLKNKQTNRWKTTKATADACYALLLKGDDWTAQENEVTIKAGNLSISSPASAEAGSGFFKYTIPGDSIKPSMGNITVTLKTARSSPSWGAVYWQYFEDMDKVSTASTPLKIEKKLFVKKNTDRGPVLELLDSDKPLYVGDRVTVRIEINSDRTLEYVHLKDMRSSALEPPSVLSEYKWQNGLGYYQSTKDASTNFFFSILPKGVHIFEYDLFVTHAGTFSNGIATIQCMYAPEFMSHSEGIKLNVESK
jgi:hypothetical protein